MPRALVVPKEENCQPLRAGDHCSDQVMAYRRPSVEECISQVEGLSHQWQSTVIRVTVWNGTQGNLLLGPEDKDHVCFIAST